MQQTAPSIVRYPPHFAALSALSSRPAGLVSSLISFLINPARITQYLRHHSLAFMNLLLSSMALLTQLEPGAELKYHPTPPHVHTHPSYESLPKYSTACQVLGTFRDFLRST